MNKKCGYLKVAALDEAQATRMEFDTSTKGVLSRNLHNELSVMRVVVVAGMLKYVVECFGQKFGVLVLYFIFKQLARVARRFPTVSESKFGFIAT